MAIDRAAIQFLGRGNCDVYADYKYGGSFNVRVIPLSGSGFSGKITLADFVDLETGEFI